MRGSISNFSLQPPNACPELASGCPSGFFKGERGLCPRSPLKNLWAEQYDAN
ncbi:MAG: hypothetical protein R2788_02985 [Saprospiraceae bacterium]